MGERIERILRGGGIERPAWEARQILSFPDAEHVKMARRRASGEPLAYVLGEWDFYGLTLKITPGVLIPRPDTEHLVETALEYLASSGADSPRVLDLCCGSGCVGLAIAANAPAARVTYADASDEALAAARANGCRDTARVNALLPPVEGFGVFDVLVCNPPYLAWDEPFPPMEPRMAFDGGRDGMDFYRALLPGWLRVLAGGGLFAVEVGYSQGQEAARMAIRAGLRGVTIRKDYAGHDRVVFGTVPPSRGE